MKRFFMYFSAMALAGALVFSCNKNNGGEDNLPEDPEQPAPKEIYVSPEGAGLQDGSSAENAMSFMGLQDWVMAAVAPTEPEVEPGTDDTEPPVTDEPVAPQLPVYENLDLIDGYTVIFADGTYVTPRDDEDLTGLEIAVPGAPEPITITFKGSTDAILSGAERARVLTVGGQVNLSINGMTIKNGKIEEGNGGGGFFLSSNTIIDDASPNGTNNAAFRCESKQDRKSILINNVFGNTQTDGCGLTLNSSGATFISRGYNVFKTVTCAEGLSDPSSAEDLKKDMVLSGSVEANCWKWDISQVEADLKGFIGADEIYDAAVSFDPSAYCNIAVLGRAYATWVTPNAFALDGRGEMRGEDFQPGSYDPNLDE